MRANKRKGFTIIELLLVIGIMAIISGAVYATIGPSSKKTARDTQRRVDVNAIAQALEMYRNDQHSYPGALNSLSPDYINPIPTPPEGGAYGYTPSNCAPCRTYQLCATGMEKPVGSYCVNNP